MKIWHGCILWAITMQNRGKYKVTKLKRGPIEDTRQLQFVVFTWGEKKPLPNYSKMIVKKRASKNFLQASSSPYSWVITCEPFPLTGSGFSKHSQHGTVTQRQLFCEKSDEIVLRSIPLMQNAWNLWGRSHFCIQKITKLHYEDRGTQCHHEGYIMIH